MRVKAEVLTLSCGFSKSSKWRNLTVLLVSFFFFVSHTCLAYAHGIPVMGFYLFYNIYGWDKVIFIPGHHGRGRARRGPRLPTSSCREGVMGDDEDAPREHRVQARGEVLRDQGARRASRASRPSSAGATPVAAWHHEAFESFLDARGRLDGLLRGEGGHGLRQRTVCMNTADAIDPGIQPVEVEASLRSSGSCISCRRDVD